ncbi:phage tail tape measure protein [Oerskovia enterophila]|uniref:Phage-related minor tail protein n=1 Tax=Oerskovia enterophila TaxID=43678 RepID=A0ABX2Y3B2_9CELL|nr:phage tail tape measure protein [Oerskovia enterophila]OCI31045.1 phage-related minor tail protein [Oerskovia enterophila]
MTVRVAELETAFTAVVADFEKGAKAVESRRKQLADKTVEVEVGADVKGATEGMDRIEVKTKAIASAKTVAQIDASIDKGEKSIATIEARLDELRQSDASPQVTADISRAEASLDKARSSLEQMRGLRAEMVVQADTAQAEGALGDIADTADDAGAEGGRRAGSKLSSGIVAALATIPIAGAVIGVGVAAGKSLADAIQDGLQVEVRQDRLQALTGISEGEAAKFGRAAGEAYAGNFGESIESNMDTARIALQGGLLDPRATVRQSQQVIESLAGIANVLDEDVRPVSVAVTQLLKTGLAKSADEAFDLLATGAREGVNAQEDLLDTFTEYPSLFQRLGLTGAEALGLINQGLGAGARNSDLAADALKEFQIRATDGSKASAEGFKTLGLNAEEMTTKIAAGGEGAREGLDIVLDKLREIEDPVARNAAAIALFGTQAEDLGEALFAMDLTTAVDQLNGVTGSAQRMFDTLSDNDAAKMESAKRNIEVAADGIKGALAAAFSEPLGDAAEFVSENRGAVVGFLLDVANGALDAGRSLVEAGASGVEAFGDFVSTVGPEVMGVLNSIVQGMGRIGLVSDEDAQSFADFTATSIKGMEDFDAATETAADAMRTNLIEKGIDPAQQRLNEFGIPQVLQAEFHDASLRAAKSLEGVGFAADGATALVDAFSVAQDGTVTAGAALEGQLQNAVAALDAEAAAGARAGETQESLAGKYELGRQALLAQLTQMGLTEDQAWALIDTYGAVPSKVDTAISSNAGAVTVEVGGLAYEVRHLPDGSIEVVAEGNAWDRVDGVTRQVHALNGKTFSFTMQMNQRGEQLNGVGVNSRISEDGSLSEQGNGLKAFASGGMTGAGAGVPRVPQIQRGGANVLWAEDSTIWEAYISGKPSMRNRNLRIWEEAGRRLGFQMPTTRRADGGLAGAPASASPAAQSGPLVARLAPEDIRLLGDYILAGSRQVSVGAVRTFRSWGGT